MTCDRAGNLPEEGRNLYFRGTNFVLLDGTSSLLGHPKNITEDSQTSFPLLDGWAPPYEEALDLLHFAYTGDRTGDYMVNASTIIIQSVVSEGGPILYPTLMHLRRSYPRAYAPLPTSTIAPPGPDYANYQPIGWVTERKDSGIWMEGGEGVCMYNPKLGMTNNLSPSVANSAMMNNLSPSLANLPLDIPPTDQVPECRDLDSPALGLHPPIWQWHCKRDLECRKDELLLHWAIIFLGLLAGKIWSWANFKISFALA